jgi:glycosyltransferase involved in cell wall biosynthesis
MMKDAPGSSLSAAPGADRLEALAKILKNVVKFAGRVADEDLPGYYRACDAWVTASEHEGFCRSSATATGKLSLSLTLRLPERPVPQGRLSPGDIAELARSVKSISPRMSYTIRRLRKLSRGFISILMP